MKYSWYTVVYWFQVYNIVIRQLSKLLIYAFSNNSNVIEVYGINLPFSYSSPKSQSLEVIAMNSLEVSFQVFSMQIK